MQDRYFDIGVNLTHESFENDYKNVIEMPLKIMLIKFVSLELQLKIAKSVLTLQKNSMVI